MPERTEAAQRLASICRVSALTAALALLAAGCGGSHGAKVAQLGTAPSSATSTTKYRSVPTKADLYAASSCMRKHGVANFPNPIFVLGKYRFGYTPSDGVNSSTPQYAAAQKYCTTRYLGFGKPFSPAQLAAWHARALKYARCIRANGLKVFPDPPPAEKTGLGSPEILLSPSLPQDLLGTSAWLHAQAACKPLSAGIAVAWDG